jgi:hypothetical protein
MYHPPLKMLMLLIRMALTLENFPTIEHQYCREITLSIIPIEACSIKAAAAAAAVLVLLVRKYGRHSNYYKRLELNKKQWRQVEP